MQSHSMLHLIMDFECHIVQQAQVFNLSCEGGLHYRDPDAKKLNTIVFSFPPPSICIADLSDQSQSGGLLNLVNLHVQKNCRGQHLKVTDFLCGLVMLLICRSDRRICVEKKKVRPLPQLVIPPVRGGHGRVGRHSRHSHRFYPIKPITEHTQSVSFLRPGHGATAAGSPSGLTDQHVVEGYPPESVYTAFYSSKYTLPLSQYKPLPLP